MLGYFFLWFLFLSDFALIVISIFAAVKYEDKKKKVKQSLCWFACLVLVAGFFAGVQYETHHSECHRMGQWVC